MLHATADLPQVLEHVRQLIAPGGLFVLEEGTRPQRWIDLTFGLTEGWWKFADLRRGASSPLLPARSWLELLSE